MKSYFANLLQKSNLLEQELAQERKAHTEVIKEKVVVSIGTLRFC